MEVVRTPHETKIVGTRAELTKWVAGGFLSGHVNNHRVKRVVLEIKE